MTRQMDKAAKQRLKNPTTAFSQFKANLHRTSQLLEAGLVGVNQKTDEVDKLIGKLGDVKGVRGPIPKDYEPQVERVKIDGDLITLKFDDRAAHMLRKSLEHAKAFHRDLRYHLYEILTVAIWGAFETYATMLFAELFIARPQLLKSKQVLTYAEVVDSQSDPLAYLTEKELEHIGHFSFTELCDYIGKRINFTFGRSRKRTLAARYLVRNIVAHNSGVVRTGLVDQLPPGVKVSGARIRITKVFLRDMIRRIESATTMLEQHAQSKFK